MNLLLLLHVLGVVIMVGNIITAAFWMIRANMSGNVSVMYQSVKNVMLADYVFTIPGIILIVLSGNLMAFQGGHSMYGFNWLTSSLVLFSITGVIWLGILIPLQRAMIRSCEEGLVAGSVPPRFKKVSLYWNIFGTIATLIPIVVLYLMINKPF